MTASQDDITAARARIAKSLAELQQLQLRLLQESRNLKPLTAEGHPRAEAEAVSELLEVYLAQNAAFLTNLAARMEARLPLLRRLEPVVNGKPESAPGHGAFWLVFSRLCAALKRASTVAAN